MQHQATALQSLPAFQPSRMACPHRSKLGPALQVRQQNIMLHLIRKSPLQYAERLLTLHVSKREWKGDAGVPLLVYITSIMTPWGPKVAYCNCSCQHWEHTGSSKSSVQNSRRYRRLQCSWGRKRSVCAGATCSGAHRQQEQLL